MTRPLLVIVAAAALSLVAFAAPAEAKVYLSGVPAEAAPGSSVKAYVAGCQAAPSCGRTVRGVWVYLTRVTAGRMNFNVLPRPRWFLGKVDAAGRLDFTLPRLGDGTYRLVARLTFGASKPQYLPASNPFLIRAAADPSPDASTE